MYVSCQLRVLRASQPEAPPLGRGSDPAPPAMFASLDYHDSHRAVVDALDDAASPLEAGFGLVARLVSEYGATVADVDIRGCDEARFSLRIPIPESVLMELQ